MLALLSGGGLKMVVSCSGLREREREVRAEI